MKKPAEESPAMVKNAMPDADARRQHAETRRRFEDVECKLSEVHEVFTLWGIIEQQRQKIEALQKRVTGIARSARRRQGGSRRR